MQQLFSFDSLPDKAPEYSLKELFDLGVHYGHQRQKWHPKMSPYIHMEKNGVHIIDLARTVGQLTLAYNWLFQLGSEGKQVIFVGTKRQARDVVKEAAQKVGAMYISTRWLGGLLTNWEQVKKSIKKMTDTEKKLAEGGFKGRTKYEIIQIEKDVARAKRFFEGIQDLNQLPSALVVVDPIEEKIAVAEARSVGIPVIALIDTNGNPSKIDLPIPCNDDAVKSISFIVSQLVEAYGKGKSGVKTADKARVETPKTEVDKDTVKPVENEEKLVTTNVEKKGETNDPKAKGAGNLVSKKTASKAKSAKVVKPKEKVSQPKKEVK